MFHIAAPEEIKAGKTTDFYFTNTVKILKAKGIHKHAAAEVCLKDFPKDWQWGVLAGIEEAAYLLEGLPISVYAPEEGTIFQPRQPVMLIEGHYIDYAVYETPLLGLLCQASGVATKASRSKKAAGNRSVISFGARRMHPALAPMIERNAYIGGCDGVASLAGADLIGMAPRGTVPHALVLMMGDSAAVAQAFHEVIEPQIKRITLVDTFSDEKLEAVRAAEVLGDALFAVRLDTPSSRRGNMRQILEEVRWELDYRGYKQVKLFVSGGLDEYKITELNPVADAYGVGASISNAPVVNFAFDLVEIEGQPIAKKGKKCGRKQLWRCPGCLYSVVTPASETPVLCPNCQSPCSALLTPLIKDGRLVRKLPKPQAIRDYVLSQLEKLVLCQP